MPAWNSPHYGSLPADMPASALLPMLTVAHAARRPPDALLADVAAGRFPAPTRAANGAMRWQAGAVLRWLETEDAKAVAR